MKKSSQEKLNWMEILDGLLKHQHHPKVKAIECYMVTHRCGHQSTWPGLPYANAVAMTKRLCPNCACQGSK